jgi:hypothetical protein
MAIVNSYQTAEYGKFIQLDESTFPAVSVTRVGYYDSSAAFPANTGSPTYTEVDIYPKYAVLSYIANPGDITVSLSAGDIDVNVADIENILRVTNTILNTLTGQTNRINGFVIPDYNRIKNNYIGSTNNLSQVDYKLDNTVVASLSFTYVGPVTGNDALLSEVIKIA